jgi:hypothetical protein
MNHEIESAEEFEAPANWRSVGDLAARLRDLAAFRREGGAEAEEERFAPVAWAAE